MISIESAGITDVGKKREINEDSLRMDYSLNLYIVADGMGGHLAGEVASKMAVDEICRFMSKHKTVGMEKYVGSDDILSEEACQLFSSIEYANSKVCKAAALNESFRGMGTTVAIAYFIDETFVAANVGDSSVYMVHDGEIEMVTVPHTLADEHPDFKLEGGMFENMLTRALGADETVVPDICESQFFYDDIFIICSDGLSRKVTSEEMLDVVTLNTPKEACKIFVGMANDRGGDDNISAVVLRIKRPRGILGNIWNFFLHAPDRLRDYLRKII